MPPACLLVRFLFLFHVTLTVLVCVMVTRLDSSLSCLRFLAYASYSSSVMATRLSWTLLRPYVTPMIRLLSVPGSSYAQFFTRHFVSFLLTRLDNILVSYSYGLCASLYLYSPDLYINRVGDGTIPIFNLLCNHPSVVT